MWVTIYTDASWLEHKKQGGWGFWARSEKGRITKHGKLPNWVSCSNSAEMAAILIATIKVFEAWSEEITGVLICTDSKTAMHYLRYRLKGFETLRRRDWVKIRNLLHKLLDNNDCKLKIKHVKGHQNSRTTKAWLNNKVDEFSRKFKK